MIKKNITFVTAAAFLCVALHTTPCQAFLWPTFDIAEVLNTISGYVTKAKSTASTIKSTLSVGKIQQAIGDNVGALSKFVDEKEKAEKLRQRLEKQKRRAERLAKLRAQWEAEIGSIVNNIKDPYLQLGKYNLSATTKDLLSKGDKYNDGGQKAYDAAKAEYEQAKSEYESIKQRYETASEAERASLEDKYLEALQKYNAAKAKFDDISLSYRPDTASGSEDWDTGDEEFDENFDDDFGYDGGFDDVPDPTPGSDKSDNPSAPSEPDNPHVPTLPSEPSTPEAPALPDEPSDSELPVTPDFDGSNDAGFGGVEPDLGIKPDFNDRPLLKPDFDDGSASDGERRFKYNTSAADKTDDIISSYAVMTKPAAFAQFVKKNPKFKTGTTKDGKFIYSDEIAKKCDMDVDELSEEKVAECVKKWVVDLHDPNAEVAAEWLRVYKIAKHDHIANDLAVALTHKNYSANFLKVNEDLEKKSEALTNEREEISFSGNVALINQEIIIRLMESLTGQLVTESVSTLEMLDPDYYKDDKKDEGNE